MSNTTEHNQRLLERALGSQEMRTMHTVPEKVHHLVNVCGLPRSLVGKHFSLPSTTTDRYVTRKGKVREKAGRPPLMTEDEYALFLDQLGERSAAGQSPYAHQVQQMVVYINI